MDVSRFLGRRYLAIGQRTVHSGNAARTTANEGGVTPHREEGETKDVACKMVSARLVYMLLLSIPENRLRPVDLQF